MEEPFDRPLCNAIAALIRQQIPAAPEVGIILGSGLGVVAEKVADPVVIPYHSLPAWPRSNVEGHKGELIVGQWAGHTVIVLNGRAHYYQGYSMAELALPVRVLRTMGVTRLIVTNAAGGLEPGFRVGDLMLITDHINLVGMAGLSPLRGPNDPTLGPRFPDMSQAYDPALQNLARSVAKAKGLFLREGVYVMVAGPAYETPADIRFLRLIGADAVGMSTVPEVVAARHAGMAVLGISGITNVARFAPSTEKVSHEEVLAAGEVIGPRMRELIGGVLERL
jgi:purine-nucleoside phosphorylase